MSTEALFGDICRTGAQEFAVVQRPEGGGNNRSIRSRRLGAAGVAAGSPGGGRRGGGFLAMRLAQGRDVFVTRLPVLRIAGLLALVAPLRVRRQVAVRPATLQADAA